MAPGGSERLTNRHSDRSTQERGSPERCAQVRTHRTAPLDQPVADPSSLPASRLRDRMNQRTPCASTGEFFNKIRQYRSLTDVRLWKSYRGTTDPLFHVQREIRKVFPLGLFLFFLESISKIRENEQ